MTIQAPHWRVTANMENWNADRLFHGFGSLFYWKYSMTPSHSATWNRLCIKRPTDKLMDTMGLLRYMSAFDHNNGNEIWRSNESSCASIIQQSTGRKPSQREDTGVGHEVDVWETRAQLLSIFYFFPSPIHLFFSLQQRSDPYEGIPRMRENEMVKDDGKICKKKKPWKIKKEDAAVYRKEKKNNSYHMV